VLDLNSMDVGNLLAEFRRHQANFDTAPFDSEGHEIRFYPGGYSLWSGFPGAGKTTIIRQFICHLLHKNQPVFVATLEEKPLDAFFRLACTALGTENPTQDGLQWCVDYWHDKLRLSNFGRGMADHNRMLATIRVLAKQGVRHAVIDSLMKLDVDSEGWEAQRVFGNLLEQTASLANVHIHLVAHPKKPNAKDDDVDLNDVAGSANLGRMADNILFIRKQKTETKNPEFSPMRISVRKQRYHTGACNDIDGYFNRRLRQFKTHLLDVEVTRYLPGGAYGEIAYKFEREYALTPWW
jgi:twinkle protein